MSTVVLPFDILECIITKFNPIHDHKTLAACCLVNRDCNELASSRLYYRLEISVGDSEAVLAKKSHMLSSACLPHNCHRVKDLSFRGQLRPNQRRTHLKHELVINAVRKFKRLETLIISIPNLRAPVDDDADELSLDTMIEITKLLNNWTRLRRLAINHVIERIELGQRGVWIDGFLPSSLQELAVFNASVANLSKMPDEVAQGLTKLHFGVGVFHGYSLPATFSASVHKFRHLKLLSIGVLNPAANTDIFQSVAELPHLERLALDYACRGYSFPPKSDDMATNFRPPHRLKSFILRIRAFCICKFEMDVPVVSRWIKHIISLSAIEELTLRPTKYLVDDVINTIPKKSWDILIDHLADKQASSLRLLDLRIGIVRSIALGRLFRKCFQLQELVAATSRGSLATLKRQSQMLRLAKVHFELRTNKTDRRRSKFGLDEVTDIMRNAHLRRLIINDAEWVASWELGAKETPNYVICQS
ncbi:hypothetical protein V5O48_000155 [Marasmius crinis-equi]|uniref:F-box domain-containing protein n=1 Tax=Marasmius crinis-equi TaxID=585013 RepID=A0ABR3G257_9AGAR